MQGSTCHTQKKLISIVLVIRHYCWYWLFDARKICNKQRTKLHILIFHTNANVLCWINHYIFKGNIEDNHTAEFEFLEELCYLNQYSASDSALVINNRATTSISSHSEVQEMQMKQIRYVVLWPYAFIRNISGSSRPPMPPKL